MQEWYLGWEKVSCLEVSSVQGCPYRAVHLVMETKTKYSSEGVKTTIPTVDKHRD